MALTIPPGVDANGTLNVVFMSTNTLSAATIASSGVEMVCYLEKGSFGMSSETERGTDERECTTQSAEVLGNTTYSLNDLVYVWEPQDASGSSSTNEVYNSLADGTTGYLLVRYGVDKDTAYTAGDVVDQVPVTLGPQIRKSRDGNNPAEKWKITQSVAVGTGVLFDQAVVT